MAGSTRILLVDDHDVVREGLRALLSRREGFDVVSQAGTVAESISEAKRVKPDVIVMDVRLPDGSGIELMQELRRRGHGLKGIAVSGYGQEEDTRRSREAGFSAHLIKPVDVDALMESVAAVIRTAS